MAKTGSKLINLKDIDLINMALQQNSQAAFFALHSRYALGLKNHISKFVQDKQDIEDICMISFQKAFKDLASYRPNNKFSTWLYTIGRNTAFDHQNKEIVRGKLDRSTLASLPNSQADLPDETIDLENDIISIQDHEMLINCIAGLPKLYKDIANLCFLENLGYKEIAEQMNLPLNTVKTRISRAKEQIIRNMQDLDK